MTYTFEHLVRLKPVTKIEDLSYDAAAHLALATSATSGDTCIVYRPVGKDGEGFECIEVTRFIAGKVGSKNVVYACED